MDLNILDKRETRSPPCPAMQNLCPFNTRHYASGLDRLGSVAHLGPGQLPVLRRPIGDTGYADGIAAWPYIWIGAPSDLRSLEDEFQDLVTVTAVTQPGYVPQTRRGAVSLLKQHYVYDPQRPTPALSARAAARLRRCSELATFDIVSDPSRAIRMSALYDDLKLRRGFAGTHMDFASRHFEIIASLDQGRFFQVTDHTGSVGAMACGVLFGDVLQILHTASSRDGLRWNASYLLMAGLQSHARQQAARLFTGGMPIGGSDGLQTFKSRWANHFEPVYLVKLINRPDLYRRLCGSSDTDGGFFPAYRSPVPPCR